MTIKQKAEEVLKETLGYTPAVLVLCPKDASCDPKGCKYCKWGGIADKIYTGVIENDT